MVKDGYVVRNISNIDGEIYNEKVFLKYKSALAYFYQLIGLDIVELLQQEAKRVGDSECFELKNASLQAFLDESGSPTMNCNDDNYFKYLDTGSSVYEIVSIQIDMEENK